MLLELPQKLIARIKGKCKSAVLKESRGWGTETFDHSDLDPTDLPLLAEYAEGLVNTDPVAKRLIRRLKQIGEVVPGSKTIKLEALTDLIRAHVGSLPNRWVFVENKDNVETYDPYVVETVTHKIGHSSGYGTWIPACITIKLKAMRRGKVRDLSGSLERSDYGGPVGAIEVLHLLGWVPETPELVLAYEQACDWYNRLRQREGTQLTAIGTALRAGQDDEDYGWRTITKIQLDRGDEPGRVVLDDLGDWGKDRAATSIRKSARGLQREEDEEENVDAVKLPEHPYVRVFDMRTHMFVVTHANNVADYLYKRDIFERLVLPSDHKDLIDALVMSEKTGDDLVSGKGRGVVILSSGCPGTGKTLTAEAYAEYAKRPLYSVQCSQLGLDPETLEKELATVLERAMRWGAILLLDEADVYIRARGDDVHQNAIVGVFLRLLEYYTGVLFMTTNRETMVDDAILSRCVVHIRYKVPEREAAAKVWKLMFDLFIKTVPTEKLLKQLLDEFPTVSPRTMKQMCRLAKTMSARLKRPLDFKMFQWVSMFQDTEKAK